MTGNGPLVGSEHFVLLPGRIERARRHRRCPGCRRPSRGGKSDDEITTKRGLTHKEEKRTGTAYLHVTGMTANCHLVTEMRFVLGLASSPLGKCTGRRDVIALSVKVSSARDSCSSRCAHFSFQHGSSGETADSTPVHQYHSQITFFFFFQ